MHSLNRLPLLAIRITVLLVVAVGLGIRRTAAQSYDAFNPGDHIIILAERLPVHVSSSGDSAVVAEVYRGLSSRVLLTDLDMQGNQWVYLPDNIYAWVQVEDNDQATVAPYSDTLQQQIMDGATAAITADNNDAEAYATRATVSGSRRDYTSAIADYTQAVTLSPQEGRFYDYRGRVYLDTQNYAAALADFQDAIGLGYALANTYNAAALAYDGQNLTEQAIDFIITAIQAQRDYGLLYFSLALFYSHSDSGMDPLGNYGVAISHDHNLANAYTNEGWLYYQDGHPDLALDAYEHALQIDPGSSDTYVNRGILYLKANNDEASAMADFNQAIQLDPNSSSAFGARGEAYIAEGNTEQAISDLNQALTLDPQNDGARYDLASLYGVLGRYTDAIDAYSLIINGAQESDDTLARLYRSQIYHAVGDDESAVQDIDTYLRNHSNRDYFRTAGFLVQGYLEIYQEDYEAAADSYLAAFDILTDFAQHYYERGADYRVTPLRENMVSDLQAQISASPQDAALDLQLANLLMEFGRWPEALQAYVQYLRLASAANPALERLLTVLVEVNQRF